MRSFAGLAGIFFMILKTSSTQCDSVAKVCSGYIKDGFIYDGNAYTVVLFKEQVGEFNTVFYGNTTYRVAACSGFYEGNLIFRVYSRKYAKNGSLLYDYLIFNGKELRNPGWWDFHVNETIPVTIELELDPGAPSSGCAVVLIGFKK